MCRLERNTARRGRSAVPLTFVRVRTWRRTRASCLVLAFTWPHPPASRGPGLRGLAGLLAHVLVLVADALALVRLGLAHLPHVRDERAREAIQAPVESLVTRSLDADRGVLADDAHLWMQTRAERSARALHGHRGVLDRDVDTARDLDGLSADTTHIATPATKRTRGPRRRCPCGRS